MDTAAGCPHCMTRAVQKLLGDKATRWVVFLGLMIGACIGYVTYPMNFLQSGYLIAMNNSRHEANPNIAQKDIHFKIHAPVPLASVPAPAMTQRNASANPLPSLNRILQMNEMQNYIKTIQKTGKEFISSANSGPMDIRESVMKIPAKIEGYFEKLASVPSVKTIFLRKPFNEMKTWILQDYYNFTSNDCRLFSTTNKYTSKNPSGCSGDAVNSLQPYDLDYGALGTAMPSNFRQEFDNEIWTYIHVVQNGIVSSHGHIRTQNVTITPFQCKYAIKDKWPILKTGSAGNSPVFDEVFVCTQFWSTAFYHSSLETAPRLAAYVKLLNDNQNIKIYLPYKANKPMYDVYGIKNLESRILRSNNFRAKVLYVPAGGPCGKSPILTTQLLSLYAKQHYMSQHELDLPSKRNKIVLIKRSQKRFFKNHNSIATMLQKVANAYDMSLFIFRDKPLPHINVTMAMFSQAAIIVAPHGAGEANMLYSQPGTVLIEGMHREGNRYNPCFKDAAKSLGLRFHGLVFSSGVFKITAEQIKKPLEFFLNNLQF